MKLTIKLILALLTVFFYSESFSQKKLDLKNSNLEGVSPEGKFWWWNNVTRKGADATFSIEDFDTNPGSQRALKVETHRLGDKGYHLSSQFNQKFKGNEGDAVTITFHAKNKGGKGKMKVVIQSDVQGSFQGKDFILTEDCNRHEWFETKYSRSSYRGILPVLWHSPLLCLEVVKDKSLLIDVVETYMKVI